MADVQQGGRGSAGIVDAGGRTTVADSVALLPVSRSKVTIVSQTGQRLVTWLGDGPPKMTDGYGGWDERERPRKSPLTIFNGSPLLKMEVPLFFDGYRTDTSVESDLGVLESMARPVGSGPPPWVRFHFPGGNPRSPAYRWVIDGFDWGDSLGNDHGDRVRQFVTVQAKEYQPVQLVQVVSPSKQRRTGT